MARTTFVLFAITFLFAGAFAAVTQDEGVYVLTTENFDEWLAEQEFALVEFYAPWCGHCKSLAPHYAEAAQALEAAGAKTKLAKVDATEQPELGQKFGVRGYPTLYWFSKENDYQPIEYEGGRDAAGIQLWIAKQTVSTLDVIPTQDELKAAMKGAASSVASVVLYGESKAYKSLVSLGRTLMDISFFHVTDEAQFGDYKSGDIVVHPSHIDPVTHEFSTEESLLETILGNAYPPVVEFSPENFQRLAQKDFTLIAVVNYNNEEEKQSLIDLMNTVATSSRVQNFGFMYGDSNRLGRGVQGAGASGDVFPTIVAINAASNTQFAYDENIEFTAENVAKWADGLLDGTTQPFRKSEPIPEDDGATKTLVAKNFDSIKGKDALVKYYAPWCGHCKTLAPIYDEVATHFQGQDVIIGKIDATANYIEEDVSGFPTLVWYSADGTSEVYQGGRTFDDLVAFIEGKGYASHENHDEL